tara:strand:- start:51 stop:299 length:249 start_codon:yes stop_codon:yes gene_type:complete
MAEEPTNNSSIAIDEDLIAEGTSQLINEIRVLEEWLSELDSSKAGDPEIRAARKSYNDMLKSRREMLNTLAKQSKLKPVASN